MSGQKKGAQAFLQTKSWAMNNPAMTAKMYEAENKTKSEMEKVKILQAEREKTVHQEEIRKRQIESGHISADEVQKIDWMYEKPPGFETSSTNNNDGQNDGKVGYNTHLTDKQKEAFLTGQMKMPQQNVNSLGNVFGTDASKAPVWANNSTHNTNTMSLAQQQELMKKDPQIAYMAMLYANETEFDRKLQKEKKEKSDKKEKSAKKDKGEKRSKLDKKDNKSRHDDAHYYDKYRDDHRDDYRDRYDRARDDTRHSQNRQSDRYDDKKSKYDHDNNTNNRLNKYDRYNDDNYDRRKDRYDRPHDGDYDKRDVRSNSQSRNHNNNNNITNSNTRDRDRNYTRSDENKHHSSKSSSSSSLFDDNKNPSLALHQDYSMVDDQHRATMINSTLNDSIHSPSTHNQVQNENKDENCVENITTTHINSTATTTVITYTTTTKRTLTSSTLPHDQQIELDHYLLQQQNRLRIKNDILSIQDDTNIAENGRILPHQTNIQNDLRNPEEILGLSELHAELENVLAPLTTIYECHEIEFWQNYYDLHGYP